MRASGPALWAAALGLLLAACGGGGGGGGTSSPTGGLAVSPSSITFEMAEHTAQPAPRQVDITITNPAAYYVGAGWPDGDPGWVTANGLAGAGGSWHLSVSPLMTLPPGAFHANLQVGIGDAGQNILALRTIPVAFYVVPVLAAAAQPLAFAYAGGGSLPAAQELAIPGLDLVWSAAADQPWIHLSANNGVTPATLGVTVDPASLAAGTHAGRITVGYTGTTLTSTAEVRFTVAAAALRPGAASLAFAGINGVPLAPQTLAVDLNNGTATTWTAAAADPWVRLDRASGTTPGTLTVTVDPTVGPLASGTHASSIRLASSVQGTALAVDVPVTLALTRATLSVQPPALVLGGATGKDFSARELAIALDTGATAHAWSAAPDASWLVPASTSGTASATAARLSVQADPAGVAPGTHTGSLVVQATVNGDQLSATVPVTFNLERRQLLVSDPGVAFAVVPGTAATTRTLRVRDSFGAASAWTAASSQPWLTVTPAGTTPGDLVLTANAAGLAADQLYRATVTLVAADPLVQGADTVQAGLWVGSAPPTEATLPGTGFYDLAMDPIRPYAYLVDGGTGLTVFNVLTGSPVAAIPGLGARITRAAVSPDGTRLFALDATNRRVVPVALDTLAAGAPWTVDIGDAPRLACIRSDGKDLVLAADGRIYDAAGGTLAGTYPGLSDPALPMNASALGNVWARAGAVFPFGYTALDGGRPVLGAPLFASAGGSGPFHYALAPDGSRLYTTAGSPYEFQVFGIAADYLSMPQIQTLPGLAYPFAVRVGKDGRAFALSSNGTANLWIYTPDGVQARHRAFPDHGISGYAAGITGDGLGALFLTERFDGIQETFVLQSANVAP